MINIWKEESSRKGRKEMRERRMKGRERERAMKGRGSLARARIE